MGNKANYTSVLNQGRKLSPLDAVWYLNAAICEGIQCTGDPASAIGCKPSESNVFGRAVAYSPASDLSFSMGLVSTGLRAGMALQSREIAPNLENIGHAVRSHLPLVIFAAISEQSQMTQLSQSGAVVFSVTSTQEVVDFMLVSYYLAEFSLIPVVVCMDESLCTVEEFVAFPSKEVLMALAENTDRMVACPSPAQQMIFGKSRKRIPNWFHVDNPVSLGAAKSSHELSLEAAAKQVYFYEHLDAIIQAGFQEHSRLTGRNCHLVGGHHSKDADFVVVSYGAISTRVAEATDVFRAKNKHKVGAVRLTQISPFPMKAVKAALSGKRVITTLEQSTSGIFYAPLYKEVASLPETRSCRVLNGRFGSLPSLASLVEVVTNMTLDGKAKTEFWVDVDFTHVSQTGGHAHSDYPKHLVMLQAIEREYPGIQQKTITSPSALAPITRGGQDMPLGLKKYHDHGPAYARVSRFYDDTAAFYRSGADELVADPFQAIPVMPPSTASFNGPLAVSENRSMPWFKAENCTGCGACFLHCPHAAINPVVIGMEQLIKTGINLCQSNGIKITHLIPLVKNLAKQAHEVIKAQNEKPGSASAFLPEAFSRLTAAMKLEGEKLEGVSRDFEAVNKALDQLPLSVTKEFYGSREEIKKESGELFSLAIDTQSCTSCGVCAAVCEDDALIMTAKDQVAIEDYQAKYRVWEQTPDTPGDTITRLLDEKKYNPFAAILLSRHFNQALHGSSTHAGEDGSKTMVHLLTALTEATIQPRMSGALKAIDELIAELSAKIHHQLGSALPSENFDALSEVLADIKDDRNPFEAVIHQLGIGDHLKLVDTKSLKRKVELAKALRTLKWLLSEGAHGAGRSRMGFVTDGHLSWLNAYPWNNFTAPVLVHLNGTTPEMAKGIVQGHIRQLLDNIKVLRRAELEVAGSYEPDVNDVQIAALSWDDLNEAEKNMVPPVLIIGQRKNIAGRDMEALLHMLDTSWPLKAIVLDDAVPGLEGYATDLMSGIGPILPVLAAQKATIVKGSLASPQHLFTGLTTALGSSKPALLWLYTPSISKHDVSPDAIANLHALAVKTRAFPIFTYQPLKGGKLLSSNIDVSENPEANSSWAQLEMTVQEEAGPKTMVYTPTWADWAFTLKTWKDHFTPYTGEAGKAVDVAAFLSLSTAERGGKIPVIFHQDQHGALTKYEVSAKVIEAAASCAQAWQLLREISGELTAFPEKLEEKVMAELKESYDQKMADLTSDYENKLTNMEAMHLEKIRAKLKEKLFLLSEISREKMN